MMSAFARERCESSSGGVAHQTPPAASASAATASGPRRTSKVSPVLEPEDDTEDEVDETFLALQKLLMNMEGNRVSQVAPVSMGSPVIHANANTAANSTGVNMSQPQSSNPQSRACSREEILESRRREREQFRHFVLSKGPRASESGRRRRPGNFCSDDDDDDDESFPPSVESTISNRMMNGSFSRYSVHVISRERWAKEETERLPIVLLPKDGKISSPADNPKLNVMHTAECIDLSEQLEAKMQSELKDHVCYLTPPRSTWCIQMRDFEALHC